MKRKKVFVDAGHGGSDAGAVGPEGTKEKDVTRSVALQVGKALERCGIEVIYARQSDHYVSLSERAAAANQADVNAFVSIHCNSATSAAASGTETYAYSKASQGYLLAEDIQNDLISAVHLKNRGVKTANFAVLRETNMAAALVELAFISNSYEEGLLNDPIWQQNAAEAIAHGTVKFLGLGWIPAPEEKENLKIIDKDGKEAVYHIEQENQNGSIWVPIRKFAELLGYQVGYDSKTKMVLLYQ